MASVFLYADTRPRIVENTCSWHGHCDHRLKKQYNSILEYLGTNGIGHLMFMYGSSDRLLNHFRLFHFENMVLKEILLLIVTLESVLPLQSSYYSFQQDTRIINSSASLGVLRARSKQECSLLCLKDEKCASAEYITVANHCILFGDSPHYSTTDRGQTTTVITLRGSCPNGHAKNSKHGK